METIQALPPCRVVPSPGVFGPTPAVEGRVFQPTCPLSRARSPPRGAAAARRLAALAAARAGRGRRGVSSPFGLKNLKGGTRLQSALLHYT